MKRAFVLLLAASLGACLNVDQPDTPTDPATETFDPSLGVNISTMTMTPSGAYFSELVIGTGATLVGQPAVTYTYIGFVKDGSTFGSGVQIPVVLEILVQGLQEGMQGMKVGGQRLIVVPSALGYGPNIAGPIPPNSTLIFRVELDAIVQ
ncbi:MAG: FKBP-type peptidyl-prolyl cis-trans isomerase [Gemmatimonadaceae bacterium]